MYPKGSVVAFRVTKWRAEGTSPTGRVMARDLPGTASVTLDPLDKVTRVTAFIDYTRPGGQVIRDYPVSSDIHESMFAEPLKGR